MNALPSSLLMGFCCIALFSAVFPARAGGADAVAALGEDGWVTIESGSRPAYVGIQGGTAPISLLRASNGLLFAFTGQTGNDFLHILRGNATSAPGVSPAASGRDGKAAPAASPATLPDAAEPAAASAAPSPGKQDPQSRTSPSSQASPDLPPQGPTLAQGRGGAAPLPFGGKIPGKGSPPPDSAGTPPPSSGAQAPPVSTAETSVPPDSPPPSAEDAPEGILPPPAIPPAVEAILADVPAGGPSLVFASGELAHVIAESQAFVPFGLPLPGEKADGGEDTVPVRKIPAFTPLKLRDYRPLLRYTGGV